MRYKYDGPVYYNGHRISACSDLYTNSKSWKQARSRIIWKLAGGNKIEAARYDIADHMLVQVPEENELSNLYAMNLLDNIED